MKILKKVTKIIALGVSIAFSVFILLSLILNKIFEDEDYEEEKYNDFDNFYNKEW